MTSPDWADLVNSYAEWFVEAIEFDDVGEYAELTTPFLDRHSDYIQVYARKSENGFILSDDGAAFAELATSGVTLTAAREDLVSSILRSFDIERASQELVVFASASEVGQRLHDMTQAILAIEGLYVLSRSVVARLFFEDVQEFLQTLPVQAMPRHRLVGRTGYERQVDFYLPARNGIPPRIVQAVQNPTRQFVVLDTGLINDVREGSSSEMRAFALLNDQQDEVPEDTFRAYESYSVRTAVWSERESLRSDLIGAS